MSELFPHVGGIADEICLIRSMTTDAINHDPAHTFMNTGSQIVGRPSMGSWNTCGLGSDHARLTYKFQGLDARLSGVEEANVIQGILG